MQLITNKEFDKIYSEMVLNFPEDERRSYEAQKNLFEEQNYRLAAEKDECGKIIAFISFWEFESFIYIEHIAVSEEYKGKGYGSVILKKFTQEAALPVIAEIELPQSTQTATRRWHFYEKLGFNLNPFYYLQPPYDKTKNPVELKIISYPEEITSQQFETVKNILYKHVYKAGE